jgi:hypothetical protein
VNTLLHYWESRDYTINWITLTSCPESADAGQLAYNLQRLRQTVERASLAVDKDGEGHSLTHITEIEQLCIRTSEGPPDKGVLHLFWAWKPLEGQHDRDFYIPQKWLSHQWGRIHGPHDEHDKEAVKPLYVWIERYGQEDYHDRNAVARYCVTQYLGEHGEALEQLSWSHGRTLGGSLTEAWEAVKNHREALSDAIEAWETVIGGEPVTVGGQSEHVHYGLQVRPPPDLGVEVVEEVSITPPEEYRQVGPEQTKVVKTVSRALPEHDGRTTRCPECGDGGVFPAGHDAVADRVGDNGRVAFYCVTCDTPVAKRGEGAPETRETEFEVWDVEPASPSRSGSVASNDETPPEVSGGQLLQHSRRGETFEPPEPIDEPELAEQVRKVVDELRNESETVNVPTVAGRLAGREIDAPPGQVRQVLSSE